MCKSANILAVKYPDVAKEWHPTKNNGLTPYDRTYASNKKAWWKCSNDPEHEWEAIISNRTRKRYGCPHCFGRVFEENRLSIRYPEIAKEWHPTKNGELTPFNVTFGMEKNVWWQCSKNPQHEWQAMICQRTRSQSSKGCPHCNSLATLYPQLVEEWHPTKNNRKWTPFNISYGSTKEVWWQCSQNQKHEWQSTVNNRTSKGNGCPHCYSDKIMTHELYVKTLQELDKNIVLKKGVFYQKYSTKLTHICPECNEEWDVRPANVLHSGVSMCMKCSNDRVESRMATALKQIFKYYYKETIYEFDLGFRGERGGVSNYDIYIPELNLVVECQSVYHDSEKQIELDGKKKIFALSKGVNYEALDHRNYSPLQAIQYFFPHIKELPEFIDLTAKLRKNWSLEDAQNLLNQGYFFKEVAEKLGTTRQAITSALSKGNLILPEGYSKENHRKWSLKEAQRLLDEEKYNYQQIADIIGNGCTESAIAGAVQKKELKSKYKRITISSIYQFTLDGKFVKSYNSSKIEGFSKPNVILACKGLKKKNPHKHKGYLWYYQDTIPQDLKLHINTPQKNIFAS